MSAHLIESDAELAEVVRAARVVAVVGMKGDHAAGESAYDVPAMQRARGMRIIAVNPTISETQGAPAYPNLAALPERADLVQVFRRIDAIPALTDELIALPAALRPEVVWLQTGIRHDPSARRLVAAGYSVVQDECLGVLAARYRR